jgi:leucyl/phenylalanyl-tRNA--protein transferase
MADEQEPDFDAQKAARLMAQVHAWLRRRRAVLPSPPPFPDPERAGPDGCVAIGGALEPDLVLEAYRRGIFPMAERDGSLGWWSPEPRAILDLADDGVHVPKRLARTARSRRFQVRVDVEFEPVIRACAERPETWIDDEFVRVYGELFRRGAVHTVESWREGRLVGGLYGVAIGAAFFAESMFHRETDAGKVAVVALIERLRARGYRLCDIQMQTSATAIFKPRRLARRDYLRRLVDALEHPATFV